MNEFIENNMWNIDINLLNSKGLVKRNRLTERYFIIYKNYKILLEKYFLNKLNLLQYDNMIADSGLKFIPILSTDMDYYQRISTMGLKYIYFRNDLYIESLSLEEMEVIVNISNGELTNPSDELLSFIEKTYKIVINSNNNDNINQMNCYGPDNYKFWFDSRELVFGFRYDKYFDDAYNDEQWQENYFKQMEFLNKLFNKMTFEFSNILGVKVNFIHYDEFTIKNNMIK